MNIFEKNNKKKELAGYREILSKEEAELFQHNIYGGYCSEYNRKVELMTKYQYKYRQTFAGIPMEVYLGNMYSSINGYMRGCYQPSDDQIADYDMLIDRINEIILCAPVLPENLVVYRAVSNTTVKKIMMQVKEYENYMENAFMSTSLLYETILEEFSSEFDVLKIYVPKGAHVLGTDGIKDRNENEMLFCEKQWLKYIGQYTDKVTKRNIYEFEIVNYIRE